MNFIVYAVDTGRIIRWGSCSEKDFASQARPEMGEGVIEGTGTSLTHRIDLEQGTPAELPVRPSPAHLFNFFTKVWEDPRSLDDFKAAKRIEINTARAAANLSSFQFAGKQIAADELSQRDIDKVALKVARSGELPIDFPGTWKAMDNTYVPIPDVETWDAFMDAMIAKGTSNFMHSETLKAAIAAATTVEEIQAITW